MKVRLPLVRKVLRRGPAAGLICLLAGPVEGNAQTRWTVDPTSSLAWWQMSPNMNHLWATTCPEEPSWRPGEGRSGGWSISGLGAANLGNKAVADTINVPLYPRWEARPLCTDAAKGQIFVADTVRWRGVRGEVVVRAAALTTGSDERDAYIRQTLLQIKRYPELRFVIDSLVGVDRRADTVSGTAVGVFTLLEVTTPMTAAVRAWPEGGGLRVLGKFRIPAASLVSEYGFSKYALGLGVGINIWQHLFMGLDAVLRPQAVPAGQ